MTDQYGERGPWHSGDEKPEIDGVYERDYESQKMPFALCKFSKGIWFAFGDDELDAVSAENEYVTSEFQDLKWRGLANKP